MTVPDVNATEPLSPWMGSTISKKGILTLSANPALPEICLGARAIDPSVPHQPQIPHTQAIFSFGTTCASNEQVQNYDLGKRAATNVVEEFRYQVVILPIIKAYHSSP